MPNDNSNFTKITIEKNYIRYIAQYILKYKQKNVTISQNNKSKIKILNIVYK